MSGENLSYHAGRLNAGQFGVEALKLVRETFVVDAQAVQQRRMQVADVNDILGDVVTVIVGRAVPATLIPTAVAVIALSRISGVAAFTSNVPEREIGVPPLTVEFCRVPPLPTR